MAASSYTRVLVHLRRATTQGSPYTRAEFSECILDSLGLAGEDLVECSLQDNMLLLQRPMKEASAGPSDVKPALYKIMHPPFCPVQHLGEEGSGSLPPDTAVRGVDVGVAVLLESSDHRLLLTRRASHMRTFPSIWVPPGGHIEAGESLEEAVLRELREETGLLVTQEERKSSHILGLWESVFPPVLGMGQPKRHHVVVYLHITLKNDSEHLSKEFKLCPEEVDAAAWLTSDLIKLAVWNNDRSHLPQDTDDHIPITLVSQEGEHIGGSLKASILTQKQEPHALTLDRISTGSRYALSLWLMQHLQGVSASQRHLYGKYMNTDDDKKLVPDSKY